jgi:hypothetical protein
VGINIDGVVIGRQGAGFTDFADIERIEVLRALRASPSARTLQRA